MKGRLARGARRPGRHAGERGAFLKPPGGNRQLHADERSEFQMVPRERRTRLCAYGKAIGRNHDELPNRIRDPKKHRWVSERDGDARRRSVAPRTI